MASYPSPQRDPFLDSRVQAILSQRGKELFGMALVGLAAVLALVLASYAPTDPTWMAATDDPVANALGRPGAALASPLMIILGKGAWGLVLALLVWGARLIVHRGDYDMLGRSVFVPIAVALTSVWLATLVSGSQHGLGGRFGDVILGALLTALPLSSNFGFNLLTLVTFAVMVLVWFHVLAVTRAELWRGAAFLLTGLVFSYAALMSVLGVSARGMGHAAVRGARSWNDHRVARNQTRREQRAAQAAYQAAQPAGWAEAAPMYHAEPPVTRAPAQRHAEPPLQAQPVAPAYPAQRPPVQVHRAEPVREPVHEPVREPVRQGIVRQLNPFARPEPVQHGGDWDVPTPELVEPDHDDRWAGHQAPTPDRIRSRLNDLIGSRKTPKPVLRFDPDHHGLPERPAAQRVAEPPLRSQPPAQPPVQPAAPAPSIPAGFGAGFGYSTQVSASAGDWYARDRAPEPFDDALLEDDDDPFSGYPADPAPVRAPVHGALDTRRTDRAPVVQPAKRKPAVPSKRAQAEAQPTLPFERRAPSYELPALSLLQDPKLIQRFSLSTEALQENARLLENVLEDYGVRGEIVSVRPGPVVTMYELEPAPGLKASRVIGLADDIARSMSAMSARVSTVPGRSVIGIELPNIDRETVVLREILSSRDFGDSQMKLPLALGKDISGEPIVANLAKMPHLLIAGTTGSGKSVAINTMILSLLYKLTPEECRLIMIDPKMLELSVYDGIPHLLSPVVTDPKKAVVALKWVVGEMEERYRKMSKMGVRNIDGYNGRVKDALSKGEMFKRTVQTGFDDETGDPVFETEEFAPELLPYIVVIVDEMADLMMVAGKEIEACIQRLAQMARASGIHLIMATQRPSVDVITGTIKANFPTRISFQVTSKIDSRTILGEQGAEQLLGMGDMLYMAGGGRISRIHGPFVSDEEVEEVVMHLKSYGAPDYVSGVLEGPEGEREADIDAVLGLGDSGGEDQLYDQAVAIVARDRKCSTSYIQRKLGIGYNKAARLVEQMEDQGVVSSANHVGKREILVPEA